MQQKKSRGVEENEIEDETLAQAKIDICNVLLREKKILSKIGQSASGKRKSLERRSGEEERSWTYSANRDPGKIVIRSNFTGGLDRNRWFHLEISILTSRSSSLVPWKVPLGSREAGNLRRRGTRFRSSARRPKPAN